MSGLAEELAPGFTDPELRPIGDWMPARYTRSLSGTEDFTTDADRLLAVVARVWRTPEVERFLVDPWQVWLLRHALETYPPTWPVVELRGQLRFSQLLISVARQNGKSVLAALLAFYFLTMHVRGPRVVGLAGREIQAHIVYDRVRHVVGTKKEPNPLAPDLPKTLNATESRGIKYRDGAGIYKTLPADEEAAQGEPISGCIYDEVHLGRTGVWSAIVKGQTARRNSVLVGITTAGDANSVLLAGLYQRGAAAIEYVEACLAAGAWSAGDDERFGFFVWEAPTDELTEDNLITANPGVACGRVPLSKVAGEARTEWKLPADETGVVGRDRVVRFTLNRFVEGAANSWASLTAWKATRAEVDITGPRVFGLHRTPAWEWASITAAAKTADGRQLVTELVASLESSSHDQLLEVCRALAKAHPGSAFVVDRSNLDTLGKALEDEEGLEVWRLTAGERAAAAAGARAAIARRAVAHAADPIVDLQMARGRRRDLGDSWRISETLSTGDIDALLATVWGLHVADVRPAHVPQIF